MRREVLPGPGRDEERAELVHRPLNEWMESQLEARVPTGAVVLDLGCGRGYWMRALGARGMRPIGLEPHRARAVTAARQGPVIIGDGLHLPLQTASVDAVWSVHILHHVASPEAMLREIVRVLRPDGRLIIAETVEDNPMVRWGRRLHPHWDGVGVQSRFRALEFRTMVEGTGLVVEDLRQHSLVSFAAWALPRVGRPAWAVLSGLERRLPRRFDRFGAHFEVVAVKPWDSPAPPRE